MTDQQHPSVQDMIKQAIEEMIAMNDPNEKHIHGLKTGFQAIDKITQGFKSGELSIIASRPTVGNSSLIYQMANKILIHDQLELALISLDKSPKNVILRLLATEAEIGLCEIRDGLLTHESWLKVTQAADNLSSSQLLLNHQNPMTLEMLKNEISSFVKESKVKAIFIDDLHQLLDFYYLSTAESPKEKMNKLATQILSELAGLAKKFNIPIIISLDLKSPKKDRRPRISDLREFQIANRIADQIVLLHRERDNYSDSQTVDVIVAKNNYGCIGTAELNFHFPTARFSEVTDDECLDRYNF